MYYIYIIRCSDNSLYTGITTNVCNRMKEHYYKTKKGAKYTRNRDVISLEVLWMANNRSDASKLEYYIKKLSKSNKEALIKNPMVIDQELYKCRIGITLDKCLKQETIEVS